MIITPGIYYDMTNEAYHSTDAISASFMKSAIATSLFKWFGKSDINKLVAQIGTTQFWYEPEKKNVTVRKTDALKLTRTRGSL